MYVNLNTLCFMCSIQVKGKGAVDVDSNLADHAHVLESRGAVYSAVFCCNTLQHTATPRSATPRSATHCDTLRHNSTHCNSLEPRA